MKNRFVQQCQVIAQLRLFGTWQASEWHGLGPSMHVAVANVKYCFSLFQTSNKHDILGVSSGAALAAHFQLTM